jgi:small subunit ribosomal protein S30e
VHGSLARAGKVRSNAPKVEKQEKKKLPKGRAFKRLQYNRRFVNVGVLGLQMLHEPDIVCISFHA